MGFALLFFCAPFVGLLAAGCACAGGVVVSMPLRVCGPHFFGGRSGLGDPRLAGLVPVSAFRSLFGPRLGPASAYQLPLFDLSLSVANTRPETNGVRLSTSPGDWGGRAKHTPPRTSRRRAGYPWVSAVYCRRRQRVSHHMLSLMPVACNTRRAIGRQVLNWWGGRCWRNHA